MEQKADISSLRARPFLLGDWTVDLTLGKLSRGGDTRTLEPKTLALLELLVTANGKILSRGDLEQALWGDAHLSEDTLARTVARLRKHLGDQAKTPRYIETISRRGYRLMVKPTPLVDSKAPLSKTLLPAILIAGVTILLAFVFFYKHIKDEAPIIQSDAALISRADDYYALYTKADNEAAIALYERVLAKNPDNTDALAGLSNALVQRVIRWSEKAPNPSSISEAIKTKLYLEPSAIPHLRRAEMAAEHAVSRSGASARSLKALGLAYSARNELKAAIETYNKALHKDARAWRVLVNMAELSQIKGDAITALVYFERAYAVMERQYSQEPQRIGKWQTDLAALIGEKHQALGHTQKAEHWYRKTLELAPFHKSATTLLAGLLRMQGRADDAEKLCFALAQKVDDIGAC